MERRAQFSILFTDEELYDNFVVYQKQQKTLKPLVLKLLTSYYYNDDVRRLVDGDDEEDAIMTSAQEEAMTYFEQCRQSLALMNVFAEGLEDLTDDSIDKFSDFADDIATKTGGKASTSTEFGKSVPQIEMISQTKSSEGQHSEKQSNNTVKDVEYKHLEDRIDYLTELVLSLTQNMANGVSSVNESPKEVVHEEKFDTSSTEPQVVTNSEKPVQVSQEKEKIIEEKQDTFESKEQEPEIDKGFDALLSSAGISF